MSNQAKDWQKGYYTVLVDGKTIAVSKKIKTGKNEHGFPTFKAVTATARCAPEDEFDLNTGVTLAMDRLSKQLDDEIKVGDKVKISSNTEAFIFYSEWVKKNVLKVENNVLNLDAIAQYAYGHKPDLNCTYQVIAIAPIQENAYSKLAYIKQISMLSSPCYLVNFYGLEKIYE